MVQRRDTAGDVRAAMRLLRTFPHASTAETLLATGLERSHLRQAFTARGRCAEMAASAAGRDLGTVTAVALAHGACPPSVRRTAPHAAGRRRVVSSCGGTASWAARQAGEHLTPAALRRLAAEERPDYVKSARASQCPPAALWRIIADSDATRRRFVAAYGACDAAMMAALGSDGHAWVRLEVAKRPDVPVKVLRLLASDLDSDVRRCVAANAGCEQATLAALASDHAPDVRIEVAANAGCGPESLWMLATDEKDEVVESAAANPRCPPEALRAIIEQPAPLVKPDVDIFALVSAHPLCPPDVLIHIARHRPGRATIKTMVGRPDCPLEALEWISRGSNSENSSLAALHPDCPEEALRRLASIHKHGKLACAARVSWPAGMPQQLCEDPDEGVRSRMAKNPACPLDLLEQMCEDPDEQVRERAASNPACPTEMLLSLAADNNSRVRYNVAANRSATAQIIEQMTADVPYITSTESLVRQRAAASGACPPAVLESLAGRIDPAVRAAVAANPNCPATSLDRLAHDIDPHVRCAVARNRACPQTLWAALAADPDPDVRGVVARRPGPGVAAHALASDREPGVRERLAGNPGCPPALLVRLAGDCSPEVSERALANPGCRPELRLWRSDGS